MVALSEFGPRARKRIDEFAAAPEGAPKYLIAAMPQLAAVPPGKVVGLNVYHDPGCGIWRKAGCDCEPDVRLAESCPE